MAPILKKPRLDETSSLSYKPISNMSVISVLLGRLAAHQLVTYERSAIPATQSGFRRGFSIETAIIGVLSDLLDAVDRNDIACCMISPRRLTS